MKADAATVALLMLTFAPLLHGQRSEASIQPGTAVGITVDRFGFGSEYSMGAATLHVSSLGPYSLSPEFAVSLFPRALAAQVVLTNLDVGAAMNIPLPHGMLLLRGGASGFVALGRGGAMAILGAHYGASLIIRFAEKSGFRFEVLRHVNFPPDESAIPTLTLGIGITALPN